MAKRKDIPKRVRFEVLKRDKFTCQYCGRQAPDVVLNIDHITPVSKGGTNDITNLVTSCFDCNSGKTDIELSDDAAVKKQKAQLDLMQERREQLEMMHEWQMHLTESSITEATIVSDVVRKLSGMNLSETGMKTAGKLVKQFGINLVCDATRIAFEKYSNPENAWSEVGGICWCKTHKTCYNCKLFIGRKSGGLIDCPVGDVTRIYSVKEAEHCEAFLDIKDDVDGGES